MTWIPVKQLPLDKDLSRLSRFLRQRGLTHRITDEGDHQAIWVQDPALADPLAELVDRWLNGEVELPLDGSEAGKVASDRGPGPRQFPATLLLLLVSAVGTLIGMNIVGGSLIPWLTFQPVSLTAVGPEFGSWSQAMSEGQFWRLLTPAFLHFGAFHILFNGLWLWELGRRLEWLMGAGRYLVFVGVTAVVANVAQFIGGPSVFGGMSGVVYALIGYIWMRQRFSPHPVLAVPPGIIGFMLVWLVICLTGIVDRFIAGSVANGAHLGGLLAGVAWGFLASRSKMETS